MPTPTTISDLPAATVPLAGTEAVALDQGAATAQASVDAIRGVPNSTDAAAVLTAWISGVTQYLNTVWPGSSANSKVLCGPGVIFFWTTITSVKVTDLFGNLHAPIGVEALGGSNSIGNVTLCSLSGGLQDDNTGVLYPVGVAYHSTYMAIQTGGPASSDFCSLYLSGTFRVD